MTDSGQIKLPPDRPPAEGQDDWKKKTKFEETPQAIMDDSMSDNDAEESNDNSKSSAPEKASGNKDAEGKNEKVTPKFPSYRASLMGFNGVAHISHIMEEDDLFKDDKEISWKLPEESDEMKKLMEIYPVAPCTQEEYNEWCEPWNYALILTVLGMKFNLYVLKDLLKNMWGFSSFELIDLPNNYFVVRFHDQELWRTHYKRVLYEGPWVIKQHCVLIQRWTPYFDPYNNPPGRVATWVRIPDVPIHYYNKHCISRLGDRIGRTLKVDMNTLNDFQATNPKIEGGKFVRLCVELNLQRKLVPKVIAAGMIFNVEYEGLHLICFSCGRFGHRKEQCPYKCHATDLHDGASSSQPVVRPSAPVKPPTKTTEEDDAFGPWMISRRTIRPCAHKRPDVRDGHHRALGSGNRTAKSKDFGHKSRFEVIADVDESTDLSLKDDVTKEAEIEKHDLHRTDMKKLLPAGNSQSQKKFNGLNLGQKTKTQYRPKVSCGIAFACERLYVNKIQQIVWPTLKR